jgi:hypothetical protein
MPPTSCIICSAKNGMYLCNYHYERDLGANAFEFYENNGGCRVCPRKECSVVCFDCGKYRWCKECFTLPSRKHRGSNECDECREKYLEAKENQRIGKMQEANKSEEQ